MKTKEPKDLTLIQIMERFPTNNAARLHLEEILWPNGIICPHCKCSDQAKFSGIAANKETEVRAGLRYCAACGKQFTCTVGTIFEDSHIPLRKWLVAWYLLCASKKGISALQVKRMLGLGSYRTAWMMMHKIRYALKDPAFSDKLSGTVEADETYIGGKVKGFGRAYKGNKAPVVALVERDGRGQALADSKAANNDLKAQVAQLTLQLKLKQTPPSIPTVVAIVSPAVATTVSPPTAIQPLIPTPSLADFPSSFTTLSGKTYQGVKIARIEDDCVTILDSEGGARIDLTDLSPDLQSRLGYDPVKAKVAAMQRAKDDKVSAAELESEAEQADAQKQARLVALQVPQSNQASAGATVAPKQDNAAIQAQISNLQADIAFMQEQEAKTANNGHVLKTDGAALTQGAYTDKIADEQAEVTQLQSTLNSQ